MLTSLSKILTSSHAIEIASYLQPDWGWSELIGASYPAAVAKPKDGEKYARSVFALHNLMDLALVEQKIINEDKGHTWVKILQEYVYTGKSFTGVDSQTEQLILLASATWEQRSVSILEVIRS